MRRLGTMAIAVFCGHLLLAGVPGTGAAEQGEPPALPQPTAQVPGVNAPWVSPAGPGEPEQDEPFGGAPKGNGTLVDTAHGRLSAALLTSANWLDSFFDEENHVAEDNRSRLRLRSDAFVQEGDAASFQLRASLRVTFPKTDERLQFIVIGNEDEEAGLDEAQRADRMPEGGEDREGVAVGLRYFVTRKGSSSFGVGASLHVRNSTVTVAAGPRWRIFVPLGSWDFRSVQRARWFSDDGWEWLSRFDLERSITARLFFRSRTDIEWFEDEDGLFPEQRFSLFHPLSTRRALKYEWVNQFVTDPGLELDDLILRVRYRQSLWRDWLFFELGPEASFPEERDHEFTAGFFFRFEAIVGAYQELPIPGEDQTPN